MNPLSSRMAVPFMVLCLLLGQGYLQPAVLAESASNYSIGLSGVFWAERDVSVYVPYPADSPEHKAVARAMEVWNRGLIWLGETYLNSKPSPYRLIETPFAGTAHIIVKFDDHLGEKAAGNANDALFIPRHPFGLGHVSITIRPEGFLGAHRSVEEQWVAVATHELGHGLGLSHSSEPQDLMFTSPSRDWIPIPSTLDLYALYELAERGPGLVTTSYLPQDIPYALPPSQVLSMSAKLELSALSPEITVEAYSDGFLQPPKNRPSVAVP